MVTVSAAGDSDATHDSATLTHTATGGGYGTVSANLPVTVTDITTMQVQAVVETVTEGTSKPIRARLPMPLDDDVSITVTVAPNCGRADEYELSENTMLTIAAGTMESTGNVEFTSLDDFTYTGTRYFTATLTSDHPRVGAGIQSFAVVDDDNTRTLLQVTPSRIFENGGTATLRAAKSTLREGVVKMTVSLEPSDRATLSVGDGARQPSLTLSLSPRWGAPATASDALWQDPLFHQRAGGAHGARRDDRALDARVDYGLQLPAGGLLTPFGIYGQSQYGRRLQVGLLLSQLGPVGLEVSGEHHTPTHPGPDDYRMSVRGSVTFGGTDNAR